MHESNTAYENPKAYIKRISWGAIFAGAIIVLVIQVTLTVIGLAIGLETVDPAVEQDPTAGLATGSMIWWIITGLIALFIGGWATSRLSVAWTRTGGVLHAIVMWGLVELLFIYLLTSAIGSIIGGAFSLVESSMSAVSQMLPEMSAPGGQAADGVDVQWQQIQQDVQQILRQTGKSELTPQQLQQEAEQAQQTIEQAAGEALTQPQQAYEEIMQALDKLLRQAEDVISEVDRRAVVNVLVKRTDMTEQEAQQVVDRWIQTYRKSAQEIQQEAKQLKKQVVQTAEEAGEAAADIGAEAAWWSALMLVLGACAAAVGGALGIPAFIRNREKSAGTA